MVEAASFSTTGPQPQPQHMHCRAIPCPLLNGIHIITRGRRESKFMWSQSFSASQAINMVLQAMGWSFYNTGMDKWHSKHVSTHPHTRIHTPTLTMYTCNTTLREYCANMHEHRCAHTHTDAQHTDIMYICRFLITHIYAHTHAHVHP